MAFLYSVTACFDRREVATQWIAWMDREHIADVLESGALRAEVLLIDGDPPRAEARYEFAHRESYERYLSLHAPRLRARGQELFGGEGVSYERRAGEIVLRALGPPAP